MSWIYLIAAGVFEIGWPLGLKLGARPELRVWGPVIAVLCMTASGVLLWLALKSIPLGTAYAVWTGVGAIGTFVVGVTVFGDASVLTRWLGIALIAGGVAMLKLAPGPSS